MISVVPRAVTADNLLPAAGTDGGAASATEIELQAVVVDRRVARRAAGLNDLNAPPLTIVSLARFWPELTIC